MRGLGISLRLDYIGTRSRIDKFTSAPMANRVRPRRSLLFMPGSNDRAMARALELPADGLIFDL
jgi:hypothetical protein